MYQFLAIVGEVAAGPIAAVQAVDWTTIALALIAIVPTVMTLYYKIETAKKDIKESLDTKLETAKTEIKGSVDILEKQINSNLSKEFEKRRLDYEALVREAVAAAIAQERLQVSETGKKVSEAVELATGKVEVAVRDVEKTVIEKSGVEPIVKSVEEVKGAVEKVEKAIEKKGV